MLVMSYSNPAAVLVFHQDYEFGLEVVDPAKDPWLQDL